MNRIRPAIDVLSSRLSAACIRGKDTPQNRGLGLPPIEDGLGTADTGLHCNSSCRTVQSTGSAFHTSAMISTYCLGTSTFKNLVRTNSDAVAASNAQVGIIREGRFFQITKALHDQTSRSISYSQDESSQIMIDMTSSPPWKGMKRRISLSTPDKEVKGVEPV